MCCPAPCSRFCLPSELALFGGKAKKLALAYSKKAECMEAFKEALQMCLKAEAKQAARQASQNKDSQQGKDSQLIETQEKDVEQGGKKQRPEKRQQKGTHRSQTLKEDKGEGEVKEASNTEAKEGAGREEGAGVTDGAEKTETQSATEAAESQSALAVPRSGGKGRRTSMDGAGGEGRTAGEMEAEEEEGKSKRARELR